MGNTVIVIAGPTASGKSGLGAALARRIGGVVINADSQQLYAALPILTAQPGPELTALAPHRLYSVIDPMERVSAAWWAGAACGEIGTALATGQMPILVGGTGLYLEALMQGLSAIPTVSQEIRMKAASDLEALGHEAFYRRLLLADPASAKLNSGDTQRILRAWEVLRATGRTLGEWQTQELPLPVGISLNLNFRSTIILPPREVLREACDLRFLAMLDRGAEREVTDFLAAYSPDAPATRALGFVPLSAWLAGNLTRNEAIAQGQAQTRQYAKRQSTWFRNRFMRMNPTTHIFGDAGEKTLDAVLAFTRA